MFFLLWMINFLFAEPTTIVVEEHANIEVYVSTPKILNYSEDTEGIIGSKSVYSYNSMYWKDAKVINERGTYDKLGLKSVVKVYDKDTIDYAYSNIVEYCRKNEDQTVFLGIIEYINSQPKPQS